MKPAPCNSRLTILGPASDLKRFERKSDWVREAAAKYVELLENSPDRHAWQFETDGPPLKFLKSISARWRFLTFLLDYDQEDERIKGLAKAKGGKLRHYRVEY